MVTLDPRAHELVIGPCMKSHRSTCSLGLLIMAVRLLRRSSYHAMCRERDEAFVVSEFVKGIHMGRRPGPSSLSAIPVTTLQAEIRRRQRSVTPLTRRREKLLAKLATLDAQIRELGGNVPGGRVRPQNSTNLAEGLAAVLKGKTMGVSEAADAVLKAGYQTNAANFRTIVNQTLIKNRSMFKKVGRGQYTAA